MADKLKVNNKTSRHLVAEDAAGNFPAATIPPGGNSSIDINEGPGAKFTSNPPLPAVAAGDQVSGGEVDVTEVDGALVVTPVGG